MMPKLPVPPMVIFAVATQLGLSACTATPPEPGNGSEAVPAMASPAPVPASEGADAAATDMRYRLAGKLVEAGRLDEALDIYDALLDENASDVRALDGRGVVLDLSDRHDEAQDSYRAALAIAPHSLTARNNLGLSLAISGRIEEAIDLLRAVVADPRADARHRQNLALAYGLAGREDAAAAVAATDLDPAAVAANLTYYRLVRTLRTEPPAPATIPYAWP